MDDVDYTDLSLYDESIYSDPHDDGRGGFDSFETRMQHLADSTRQAAHIRPSATISAEVMALVYEAVIGRQDALHALRRML